MTNTNQPDATTSDAPSQPTAGDDYIERSAAIEVLEQQKTNGSDEDAIMDYATEQAIKALRILPAATPTSSHSELADRQFGASYRRDLDRWIIYEQTNDGSVPFAETYGYDKERVDMVLTALRQRPAPEPSGMREALAWALPLAAQYMEVIAGDRARAGHTGLGTKRASLYDVEVEQLERARAALAATSPTGDSHDRD